MMPANRSTSAAATDSLIGQTIGGQYTLQRFLGHGSKARVFLATHRTLHRTVVVHLLSVPWADDTAAVAKFEEQARALRGLEHPNIAAVIDFGREPGRVFVVGEYVEGKLLSSYLKQLGRLTLEGFVPIAAQILKGLGATHARGLVHRDIKPTNLVLVEEQGRGSVKILDLGLAQILEGPPRGDDVPLVGTPEYLAPEQIMNKAVDPRTDVYALGVLFYQMVSGRLPFEGEGTSGPRSVLYKHVNDKPTPLTQSLPLGSNVPDGLIDLIHDCLAKNPDNRPADANEIVERLIDSVPAALFRLPVAGATSTRTPTGEIRVRSTTGDLPRTPTGEFRVPAPRPEPIPQHDRALAAAVEASGLRPVPTVDISGDTTTAPTPAGGGGSSWVLGILALLLTSGLVYIYIQNQNNAATPPQPAKTEPPVVAAATAGVAADAVDPALERDLTRAREAEAAGKLPEAIAAYEDVLVRDPDHALARERIAALKAMTAVPTKIDPVVDPTAAATAGATAGDTKADPTAGDTKVDPTAGDTKADPTAGDTKADPTAGDTKAAEPVHVAFTVEAYPKSEVFVDGVSHGKTPAKLDLLAGPHNFEIKFPGFIPHVETIEVAAEGQKSLKVKLVRKPPGTGGINRAEEDAASAQLDPENDAPTTKIEVPLKR
jgi:serine/threonine protein kinase